MRIISIFNIKFIDAHPYEIIDEIKNGAFITAPAAPALAMINDDKKYLASLKGSDFAIFDSGFLCICLLILKGIRVKKLSGLSLIRFFLKTIQNLEKNSIFLINPSHHDGEANKKLLKNYGYLLQDKFQYTAPYYKKTKIEDIKLLKIIDKLKPKYIVINIGGGTQEILALYIRKNLRFCKPALICTGAAMAFLNGKQAAIPPLFDTVYMGWLLRCLYNPKRFVSRYLYGFKLLPIIIKEEVKIDKFIVLNKKP